MTTHPEVPFKVFELDKQIAIDDWSEPIYPPTDIRPLPTLSEDNIASWNAEMGLRKPSLYTPVENWPLSLALTESLNDAFSFAQRGILTIGQYRQLTEKDADPKTLETHRKIELIEAILVNHRIGHSRPFEWVELESTKLVSKAFHERVLAVYKEHQDFPDSFIAAIKLIPRFNKKALQIQEHFENQGILDVRTVLTKEETILRVAKTLNTSENPKDSNLRSISAVVDFILSIID